MNQPICPIVFEEWKFVNDARVIPNYYEVSTFGRVRNPQGQILKSYLINSGYYVYKLFSKPDDKHKNRYKTVLAHRLVKETFDPVENQNELTVNHDDLIKAHNFLYNLSWMTQAENNLHKINNLHVYGSKNYQAAFTREQLRIIVSELEKGTKYKDILIKLGIDPNANNQDYIGNIKRGKTYQKEIRDIINE